MSPVVQEAEVWVITYLTIFAVDLQPPLGSSTGLVLQKNGTLFAGHRILRKRP
jgi:hypothetical protein